MECRYDIYNVSQNEYFKMGKFKWFNFKKMVTAGRAYRLNFYFYDAATSLCWCKIYFAWEFKQKKLTFTKHIDERKHRNT